MSRVIDLATTNLHINIHNRQTAGTLWGEVVHASGEVRSVSVPNTLSTNQWHHVALVGDLGTETNPVSRFRLQLFLDGALLAEQNGFVEGINASRFERKNYLGRFKCQDYYANDADFAGQIDEVRIWSVMRTAEQ